MKTEEAFQNEETARSYGNFVNNRYKAFHSSEDLNSERRRRSVYFTLGDEDVSYGRKQLRDMCQCVNPLPSLPKSQTNNLHRLYSSQQMGHRQVVTMCEICHKTKIIMTEDRLKTIINSQTKVNDELQFQTYDLANDLESTLEDLLQNNCVIELPMPQ